MAKPPLLNKHAFLSGDLYLEIRDGNGKPVCRVHTRDCMPVSEAAYSSRIGLSVPPLRAERSFVFGSLWLVERDFARGEFNPLAKIECPHLKQRGIIAGDNIEFTEVRIGLNL